MITNRIIGIFDVKTDTITKEISLERNITIAKVFNDKLYVLSGEMLAEFDLEGDLLVETDKVTLFDEKMLDFVKTSKVLVGIGKTNLTVHKLGRVKTRLVHFKSITDIMVSDNFIYTVSEDMHLKTFGFDLHQRSNLNVREKLVGVCFVDEEVCVIGQNSIYQKKKATLTPVEKEVKVRKLNQFDEDVDVIEVDTRRPNRIEIDKLLFSKHYKKAFDTVFESRSLSDIYYVLKVIEVERAVKTFLQDRGEDFIIEFFEFMIDWLFLHEFQSVFVESTVCLSSMYQEVFLTEKLRELTHMFSTELEFEIKFAELKIKTISFLEAVGELK